MSKFQPGQSGNPAGRPPKAVEDARQSVLLRLFNEQAETATVKAMIREAKRGNVAAFKELMDRKYGKVKDQVELSGPGGGPIVVREVIVEVPSE